MENQISVKPIDVKSIENQTSDVTALAKQGNVLVISSQCEYEDAAELLQHVKSRHKELDAKRKTITNPLDAAKKAVMELFRKPLISLGDAERKIKRTMIEYTNEVERKAEEERKKLQKLADDRAKIEERRLQAKIDRAKASGKDEKVELLEEEKENVIPISVPVVAPSIEKPKGVSYKDKWSAEVVDIALVPREYMTVNQSALDKIAQATKGTIQIAGVKFNSEKVLSSRG